MAIRTVLESDRNAPTLTDLEGLIRELKDAKAPASSKVQISTEGDRVIFRVEWVS